MCYPKRQNYVSVSQKHGVQIFFVEIFNFDLNGLIMQKKGTDAYFFFQFFFGF